jgi:tripartite-type tricarboxylate transporter receptor subunit TctC
MFKGAYRWAAALFAAGMLLAGGVQAQAQSNYPLKPIRVIVPFPPGGGTDILTRLVTNSLGERLGWQFVLDNRPGAGGTIGLSVAAKSSADGYTLVMGQTSNLAINPTLYGKVPYDSLRDFAPISLVSAIPNAYSVSAKSPFTSLGSILAAAKAKPGEITYGTSGNGTVSHLSVEMLKGLAGVKMIHVPYKGAAAAMPDVITGRISFYVASVETMMPHVKAGNIRALAVTSLKRSPSLPDVPAIAESFSGFEALTWFGFLAPAGTPTPIIQQLSQEITNIVQLPDVRAKMVDGGGDIERGAKAFAALLKADVAKWARIVKESGAKVD